MGMAAAVRAESICLGLKCPVELQGKLLLLVTKVVSELRDPMAKALVRAAKPVRQSAFARSESSRILRLSSRPSQACTWAPRLM
jgi:hypothetical protein